MPLRLLTLRSLRPRWALLLILLLAFVSVMALLPKPPSAASSGWDKLDHAAAFATLAAVGLQWQLLGSTTRLAPALATVLALLLAYGGLIELLQTQVPGRQGDIADLVADGAGILLGLAFRLALPRPTKAEPAPD